MASECYRVYVEDCLTSATSWTDLRHAFLEVMSDYGTDLCHKPDDWFISSHEAGGAWRPIFSHLQYQEHAAWWTRKMAAVMRERRQYAQSTFWHGFPDEAEVHHEIETFIYFQMPLWHHRLPGHELALESILDVAEHVINAVDDVPPWYDWNNHRFRSTYLGTRTIRDGRPFDHQEGNHWRFADLALTAYRATLNTGYLEMVSGYAQTWCRHISAEHARDEVIRCSILPAGAKATEMCHSGTQDNLIQDYQIFYRTAAANTAYDIACGLLDVYRTTGNDECRRCAAWMLDQFFANAHEHRPATYYSEGAWNRPSVPQAELSLKTTISQMETFLARAALRYDIVTAENRYKDAMVAWANAIDEERWLADQTLIDPLIAAWHYTQNENYLYRAFAMALRLWAVTHDIHDYHMCSTMNCYGSKFLMESCYFPITGQWDSGTRGNLPLRTDSVKRIGPS